MTDSTGTHRFSSRDYTLSYFVTEVIIENRSKRCRH